MRILFVGDSLSSQYVTAFYKEALKREDITAELFDYGKLRQNNIITRLELHFKSGMHVNDLNTRLIMACESNKYDLVLIYYSTLLYGDTIKKIRKTGCKVFMYCNDNPFSNGYKSYVWRHLKKQIPHYDMVYAYRECNIEDYKKAGAKRVRLLKSYFISDRNYYIADDAIDLQVPDVVYVGHREDDGRDAYIEALLNEGISVGLNHAWTEFGKTHNGVVIFDKSTATYRYNEILNKAKIAIVFLSKLNGDGYTRRCFEIPAAKTLMIAPYTEELSEMYEEGREAVYYRSVGEFVDKIKYYIAHSDEREEIAEAGFQRLMKAGDDVSDRFDQIMDDYYGEDN